MKLEFEGSADDILNEMVALFNRMGLKVVPFTAPEPEIIVEAAPPPPQPAAEPPQEAKKRGRPPRKEPAAPPPQPAAVAPEAIEEEDEEEIVMGRPETSAAAAEAIALHKVKEETLKRLRDLFIAGKGGVIRELLKKHGHGALVFPEIDAKYFPAIKADIDRELN